MLLIILLIVCVIILGCSNGYDDSWGMDKYNNDGWTKDWF